MRWVASSHRTVKAVWTMHKALYAHFQNASQDKERSGNERVLFQGLSNKLSSGEFLKNMGLMLDALEELKDLSESLQASDISLFRAMHLKESEVDVFLIRRGEKNPCKCLLPLTASD